MADMLCWVLQHICSADALLTALQTVTLSQLDSLRRELIAITRNGFGRIAYGKVHTNDLQLIFVGSAWGLETCRCQFTAGLGAAALLPGQTR